MIRFVIAAAMFAACAPRPLQPSLDVLDASPRPARTVSEVEVYREEAPSEEYRVIARWQASAQGEQVESLQEEAAAIAARVGADAVIVRMDYRADFRTLVGSETVMRPLHRRAYVQAEAVVWGR